MADVAGRPFLEHLLDYWISQGVEKFVFCAGYMSEVISNHFGTVYKKTVIEYSLDQGELGTGGALSLALSRFPQSGNFLVLNGDTYFPIPILDLKSEFKDLTPVWVIGLFKSTDFARFTPISIDAMNAVQEIGGVVRRIEVNTGQKFLVNGGVHLVNGSIFGEVSRNLETPFSVEDGLMRMIEATSPRVLGLRFNVDFLDIGTPEDLEKAQTFPPFLP